MLAQLLPGRGGVAVVALGGYARRELCPASDIDIVLLHDGWGRTDLEGLVQQLCYPLWDAGLSVGHAVRTPAEAAAAASDRIDTATAVLDRRLVAGDTGLVDAFAGRVRRWTRRNGRKATVALDDENLTRRRRNGDLPGMLEPNLKDGAGGLRDIHALRWAAGWVVGEPTLDSLVAAGYISAEDRRRLAVSNATLLEARCALHQVDTGARGKDRDVLRMEWHDDVAARIGLHDATGRGDGERLLSHVGLAMREVAQVHNRTWPLLVHDVGGRRRRRNPGATIGDGLRLQAGLVEVDPAAVEEQPHELAWRAVAAAGDHRVPLGRDAATRLSRAVENRAAPSWTPSAVDALVGMLDSPGVLTALAEADHIGLLAAYLPGWSRVRARPQRNALHRFDLDTHGAHAVRELRRMRTEDEGLAEVWERLGDPAAVLLATWLHDVGKAWPGDHSESGAAVVAEWLGRMGVSSATRRRATALVRHHLLLPDVATRRDLDDPAQVQAVAEALDDAETADALLLLSLADSRATGTAAWSAWKDSLLARLHRQVRAILTGAPDAATRRRSLAGPSATRAGIADLHRVAPERYLEVADDDQAAAHAALLPAERVRAALRNGHVPGTTVVTIAAPDREGLIADCTGVLAGYGVEVYEARAFTGGDGVALAWFTTAEIVDLPALVPALEGLGAGTTDVAGLLTRRRWGRSARRTGEAVLDVTVRDRSVEVEAPDSPALLYRLCATLAEFGCSVSALRVSTLGATAFDVFDLAGPVAPKDIDPLHAALTAAARAGAGP